MSSYRPNVLIQEIRKEFIKEYQDDKEVRDMGVASYMCCDSPLATYNDLYVHFLEEKLSEFLKKEKNFK